MNGHSTMIANAPTLRLTRSHSLEIPDSPPDTPLKTTAESPTRLYKALNGSSSMETLLETNYKNALDQFSPTHFSKQWTESSIVVTQKINTSPSHHGRSNYISPTHSRSPSGSPPHYSRSQNVSPTHSITSHHSGSTRSPSPSNQNTFVAMHAQQHKSLNVQYKALSQSNDALDNALQNEQEPIRPRSVSTPHRNLQRPNNLMASMKMNGEVTTPEDSVKDTVLKAISGLHGLSDFANQSAKMLVKSIGDCYWKNVEQRQHIADVFAANGGAGKLIVYYIQCSILGQTGSEVGY